MRINNISIAEFYQLRDMELVFQQPHHYYFKPLHINIIVGQNGTGKTTLLKFLSQVFIAAERSQMTTQYQVDFELASGQACSINQYVGHRQNPGPAKVIVSTFSPHEQYNRKSGGKYAYVGAAGNDQIKNLFYPLIEIQSSDDFMKRDALQNLLREIGYPETPFIELDYDSLFNNEYIGSRNETLRELLFQLRDHHNRFSVEREGRKLLPIDSIHNFPGGRKKWMSAIKKFRVYGNTRIANLWFHKRNHIRLGTDTYIPMTSLSSGEMTMYFRIFRILNAITNDALVLIDEPETHLHPKWIQKYTMLIRNVFREYTAHFIIATHSPIITSDVPRECIVALKKSELGVEPYYITDRTLGTSPREILHEVFGLTNYVGDLTNEVVQHIRHLLRMQPARGSNDYNTLLRLYRDLGDSDQKFELFNRLADLYPEDFGYVED
ncbi:AAA family ATPase [Paenibacillus tarimensis]